MQLDTATHLAVGIGLAGLSHLDPAVTTDSQLAAAVYIGTIVGSQAPDSDTILRMRSNALYIRHHRGITHSLPAILIWTILIGTAASWITGTGSISHVLFWTFAAVCVHVWQDLFNAYGTKALWPLSKRWIAWNIIHIFDPFIFVTHLVAISLWILQAAPPQLIFPVLYAVMIAYYVWRTIVHAYLGRKIKRLDPMAAEGGSYVVFPTYKIGSWNIVKKLGDGSFRIGEWHRRRLRWLAHVLQDQHPAVEASRKLPDVRALLNLTEYAYAECSDHAWGCEVRWIDVRYHHRKQYPFVAIARFDHHLQPLDSYVGWLSEAKLKQRLRDSS